MVILTAAAATAAGYGVYKGGEASVNKGKEAHREFKREKKRASQRSSLREKTNARSSRISEILQMKQGDGNSGFLSSITGSKAQAQPEASTTFPTSYTERQLAEKEAGSEVNDRHRAVMEKLRSGRRQESKKGSKKTFGLFGKK